ncbi:MAG: IS110 family transposase [Bacteroidales bacterium]|nr:IS110 family transposase [Bacteroidales bacterium]
MKKIKFVIGIDISMDDFHVCFKEKDANDSVKVKGSKTFKNNYKGFQELTEWVSIRTKSNGSEGYVMEATGVYHEDLAYFLHSKSKNVYVILANKIKYFAKSHNLKTKTDKVDAAIIAQYGIERTMDPWKPMSKDFKKIRDLVRELLSMKKEKTRAMSQLHAMNHSHEKEQSILNIKKEQIDFYKKQIDFIESEIVKLVNSDIELKTRIENITKIKGLKLITVITILCETNGFELFKSIRQVVSYAGLDVTFKDSGKFKGQTKISKKGNARIRQCLFMPALSATNHNEKIMELYKRINERNPTIKMKGVVAGMRKLLVLIFVLWKKNEAYDPQYAWK